MKDNQLGQFAGRRRARRPFGFWSCVETRESLGLDAKDLEELLAMIETAPPGCLVCHMQTCTLRHPHANGEFGNDFAAWVAFHVQDTVLAKRLGHLDPFAYSDIEQLRLVLISIMADHLSQHPDVRRRPSRESLTLFCSHLTEADLHREAWTLEEFRDALGSVEPGSIYLHACGARVRMPRRSDDFAFWLGEENGLGLPQLAEQVRWVCQLGLSLEKKRERILHICDQAMRA